MHGAAVAALRAIPAARFIPGHGPPGGPEIVDRQAEDHAAVTAIVRGARSPAEAAAALRARYPDRLLEAAIASAVDRIGGRG